MSAEAIWRIVKTASAAVTGSPSSQTASGRSVRVNSRPSGEASMRSASPGTRFIRASKSSRLRETYWRTSCSGTSVCSTALSVPGSPKSRRKSVPPRKACGVGDARPGRGASGSRRQAPTPTTATAIARRTLAGRRTPRL